MSFNTHRCESDNSLNNTLDIYTNNNTSELDLARAEEILNSPGTLTDKDRANIESSGIDPDKYLAAGVRSLTSAEARVLMGYAYPGLFFPYRDKNGNYYRQPNGVPYGRIRPHEGCNAKYLCAKGAGNRLYISPFLQSAAKVLGDINKDILIVEGEKKADAAVLAGFRAVGLSGVHSWVDHRDGESAPIPELEEVNWEHRKVYICFDSDIITNANIQRSARRLAEYLTDTYGARVHLVVFLLKVIT